MTIWPPGNRVLQQAPARTGFVEGRFKDLPKPRALSLFKALPEPVHQGVPSLNSAELPVIQRY